MMAAIAIKEKLFPIHNCLLCELANFKLFSAIHSVREARTPNTGLSRSAGLPITQDLSVSERLQRPVMPRCGGTLGLDHVVTPQNLHDHTSCDTALTVERLNPVLGRLRAA